MSFIHAVVLGIVEGVTEFLPISSTGHLILASKVLGVPQTEFVKSFEIAIQFGAILSVVTLYFRELFVRWEVMKRIAAAFIPTAAIGFVLYKFIKQYLFNDTVVLWSLFLGGIVLILFERLREKDREHTGSLQEISYTQAIGIGLAQTLAVIPGVSRAAATILGGMMLGVKRRTIVEFSFLLAVPTMAAATTLDLLKTSASFNEIQYMILFIGGLTSFTVAILAMRFLLHYVERHTFTSFGWYRIFIAIFFWLIVLL